MTPMTYGSGIQIHDTQLTKSEHILQDVFTKSYVDIC